MNPYNLMAMILTVSVMVGYINSRFIKMPTTIGIMVGSLAISFLLIVFGRFTEGTHLEIKLIELVNRINFHDLLMNGMLSFLLFAGALQVDIDDLRNAKWEIAILASLSTIASTIVVGLGSYYFLDLLQVPVPLIFCLLFGALISPTDPIAVLAMLKDVKAPPKLNVMVAGESLFNDGVAIVIFLTLYHIAFSADQVVFSDVISLFAQQALGGVLYGILLGLVGYWLIEPVDSPKLATLVTIAIASGGYAFAEVLGVSGPLAMVASGIFIGNRSGRFKVHGKKRETIDEFWELIDEVLNAVLFLLIGFEILIVKVTGVTLSLALLAIPLVLLSRTFTVALPMWFFKLKRQYPPHTTKILIWGGLRGGLAVALALSLPKDGYRDTILVMTYAVVIFSIVVQGLSIKPLVQRSKK